MSKLRYFKVGALSRLAVLWGLGRRGVLTETVEEQSTFWVCTCGFDHVPGCRARWTGRAIVVVVSLAFGFTLRAILGG